MQQYELNLRDYLRIFLKRKFIIGGVFIVVLFGTFLNLSRQPYIYEASTTVKIEERKTVAGLLTEWIVFNPEDVMESQTKIIRGFPVMEKVARRLNRISADTPPSEAQQVISRLKARIMTEKITSTNLIKIMVTGTDPKEVVRLANTVADVYVEENLLGKTRQARSARQFIQEQLFELEKRLAESEEKLRTFGNKVSEIRLAEPIQNKIIELQFEMTALLQKYTEKHPKILHIRQQIKDLEVQIKDFSREELVYGRLLREVEVSKKLYGMLKEKLEEARITEAQKVSDVSRVDPAILPTSPISPNKRIGMLVGAILGLVLGVGFAFLSETMDPSIGTIEDVENVIKLPVLGVVPSIHSEAPIREAEGVFSFFKAQTRTKEEKAREHDRYVRLFVHYKPTSMVAEAFRNIQANLKIDPEHNKVFVLTSSGPGEGKTTSLINLGLTCAQSGLRTLLVSSDLRRPAVAKAFGIKRDFGLREYLEGMLEYDGAVKSVSDMVLGEMGFDEILKFPGIENISVIPSGEVPSNAAAMLKSEKLMELIREARRDFDVIFFDTPPVLPIADASILAPLADSVILVYEIGKTARQALMRAKIQIESTGAKIKGVVLNNIKSRTEYSMFSYPYYYKYKYTEKKST